MDRGAWQATVHGVSWTRLSNEARMETLRSFKELNDMI